jgi:hypothetical protein
MSRTIFLSMNENDVLDRCKAEKVGVSAIERLPAGGVRLVCMSGHGSALIRRKLKAHLMDEHTARERHRPLHPLW